MHTDELQNVFCSREGKLVLLLRHRPRMMISGWSSSWCLFLLHLSCCASQDAKQQEREHRSSFSCVGRLAGYYADIGSGCQLYHLCDAEGRRFTHSCPNATLFQQRMMICDHWYMVDCSKAHHDYSANLLIGQRDKPFVSAEEHVQRHPVKQLTANNGALQHPNWFPHTATTTPSSRRARNRNTPSATLPQKYKGNIFLERVFATVMPKSEEEVSQNVLELHLVDPRHMFYIPEDSAPSSDNNTVLFIAVPSSTHIPSAGVMKFRKEQNQTSETQNPSCPKCHPEYLSPGKCEPCVVIR